MTTMRQIERSWTNKQYQRLFNDLTLARPEERRVEFDAARCIAAAAAMAMIRMDELGQAHLPFFSQLLRSLLASQDADGGWGDLTTTALCLRALLLCRGQGQAVDRALQYLVNLQKSEGIWPKVPLRRMTEDPYVSAFILYQLAEYPVFRQSVRFDAAMAWFETHGDELDAECKGLWAGARHRAGRNTRTVERSLNRG